MRCAPTMPIAHSLNTAISAVVALGSVLYGPPTLDFPRPRSPPPTPRTVKFTADSFGITTIFRYPATWIEESSSKRGACLVPASGELGARMVLSVNDWQHPAERIRGLPYVPPGATMVGTRIVDIGGHKFHLTELRGNVLSNKRHVHSLSLEGAFDKVFVLMRCDTSAPLGYEVEGDRQFEKWRTTFEAVLSSLYFQPSLSVEQRQALLFVRTCNKPSKDSAVNTLAPTGGRGFLRAGFVTSTN